MATLLHIDSSARTNRSHTRSLTARFVARWQAQRPGDAVIRRDVGVAPPAPVNEAWIAAAFAPPAARDAAMQAALGESDALVDELLRADLIVAGVPMYNFGMPAGMKAWVDNVVRVGRTFGFDRGRLPGDPYWPMLSGKRLIVLSARGDTGYAAGERMAHVNHVEPHLTAVFAFLGVCEAHTIAVECDEFGDDRLARSLAAAEEQVDRLVASLAAWPEERIVAA